MTIANYIDSINQRYKLGNATEHTCRGDLQQLLEALVPEIRATNEPKRQSCGAPDYILTKKDIPVGFIEAKDIGDKDLDGAKKTGHKEQFDRYKASLNNLIFTDYINFHLYRDGEFVTQIAIAEITAKGIKPLPENFGNFENLIKDFCSHIGQNITSSKKLAEMMAGKARLLSDVIEKALASDETHNEDSTLKEQMVAFKDILIHDITAKGFADIYAQTIAYGMFAARLHDPSLETFSRQEAAELIPKSNPFLRKLFGYIAGPDIDDRIKWIVENLAEIFLACNVQEILKNYGKTTKMEDPIIHFYETFLAEYDPKLRKARGVWYTPAPVVNFIVRAVDDILKTEFDLPQGLADTSKIKLNKNYSPEALDGQPKAKDIAVEEEVHKVQILDPATGTGTFLAEVIKQINKKFQGQEGIWSSYVENDLLPRLNGFELLMASYAMAHLQLDLLLKETGYKKNTTSQTNLPQTTTPSTTPSSTTPSYGHPSIGGEQRIRVYLTNSLEEHHPDAKTLFANWLSAEANEANQIKRDTPVMCVIGNPPYAVSSTNKGKWIENLTSDYKKDLNERNIQPLSDDYIKFIRYGQHYIENNGEGILAYISNNSFIDGIIHRQMRKNILETFDKIYILDLHGNANRKEKTSDGSVDDNVFDIQQGVSINIFIKSGKINSNEICEIKHLDLFGRRNYKYDFLLKSTLNNIGWETINPITPNYYFVPKNFEGEKEYSNLFSIKELFFLSNVGINTEFDDLALQEDIKGSEKMLSDIKLLDPEEIITKHNLPHSKIKKVQNAKSDILNNDVVNTPYMYRPFDVKYSIYTGSSNGIMGRPRGSLMKHIVAKNNIGLVSMRQYASKVPDYCYSFISKIIVDNRLFTSNKGYCTLFPLYLYPENGEQSLEQDTKRRPNLNPKIVQEIAEKLGLQFTNEKSSSSGEMFVTSKKFPSSGGVVVDRGGRNTQNYMSLPYNPKLKERARELRKAGNLSEVLFWNKVKNKQFKGFDFDRQKIIGHYIVDFYCTNCHVVIEIDGSSHDDKQDYDAKRDAYLKGLGLTVIHITNSDVKKNLNDVMERLYDHPALKGTPPGEGNFAPIDILDYIYAVLHSPSYRKKYKEFLKIDFPRVPYPKDPKTFWQLVKLGREIRQIHLLESPKVENYITSYPKDGNNVITTAIAQKNWELFNTEKQLGRIWINDTQYFDNIPLIAWEFYIGGYQPAQKWLKDRKGRKLEFDDILHYQKIIVALFETDRLMKEIDTITIE